MAESEEGEAIVVRRCGGESAIPTYAPPVRLRMKAEEKNEYVGRPSVDKFAMEMLTEIENQAEAEIAEPPISADEEPKEDAAAFTSDQYLGLRRGRWPRVARRTMFHAVTATG